MLKLRKAKDTVVPSSVLLYCLHITPHVLIHVSNDYLRILQNENKAECEFRQ